MWVSDGGGHAAAYLSAVAYLVGANN